MVINTHRKNENSEISEAVIKRENMVIAILLTEGIKLYEKFKQVITADEFKYPVNKEILQKIYDEFEKGNDNINSILDSLQDEEILKQITKIMADDYDIQDMNKAVLDVIKIYEKEKIISRRNKVLSLIENTNITNDEKASLEKELSDIIIKLARFK